MNPLVWSTSIIPCLDHAGQVLVGPASVVSSHRLVVCGLVQSQTAGDGPIAVMLALCFEGRLDHAVEALERLREGGDRDLYASGLLSLCAA